MLFVKVFEDLQVISILPKNIKGHYYWNCSCRCGNTKWIREQHLKSGASTSCGLCNYPIKHPLAHKSWDSMHQRCNNKNAPDYPRYGGSGITVCSHWNKFINFLEDMGDPPVRVTGERLTLNRIKNELGYFKKNCEWADKFDQAYNRSTTLHQGIFRYSNGNRRK